MKKFLVVAIAMAVTIFGVSASASAHDSGTGGTYPPRKPMVAPGRSVVGPENTTVGIYASRFCPNKPITIKLTKNGAPTITRFKTTNGRGEATVWINTSKLKTGTYLITAKQPACYLTATSQITKRARHNVGAGVDGNVTGALGDLTADMAARAAAVADRASVRALGSASSGSDGLQVLQLTLVALVGGSGMLAVSVRRRRLHPASVNPS